MVGGAIVEGWSEVGGGGAEEEALGASRCSFARDLAWVKSLRIVVVVWEVGR